MSKGTGDAVSNPAAGATAGAAAGSVVPGIGTIIGAAVGGGLSLLEASNQSRAARAAEEAAAEAIADAEKRIDQEFLGSVRIPMDTYNRAMNQVTANQQQGIAALQESGPRELAGAIGRVNEVGNQEINNLTGDMANKLYNLSIAQATEKGGNSDQIAALRQNQAMGAQIASMAAQKAKIASQQGALNLFGGAISDLEKMYGKVYKPNPDQTIKQVVPSIPQQVNTTNTNTPNTINQPMNFDFGFGGQNSMSGEIIGFDFMGNPIYKQ